MLKKIFLQEKRVDIENNAIKFSKKKNVGIKLKK